MVRAAPSELSAVDVAAVLDAARAVDCTVYSVVEFDRETFNTLYAAAETRALYDSEAEMEAHFERIHSYVNIDFTEAELFTEDLFEAADHVRYKATSLDVVTILRVYIGDETGLFLAIGSGDPVERLVTELEAVVER